jgi:hypothetical protein
MRAIADIAVIRAPVKPIPFHLRTGCKRKAQIRKDGDTTRGYAFWLQSEASENVSVGRGERDAQEQAEAL